MGILLLATRMGPKGLMQVNEARQRETASNLTSCGIASKTQTPSEHPACHRAQGGGCQGGSLSAMGAGSKVRPWHSAQSWCGRSMWLQVTAHSLVEGAESQS